MFWLMQARPGCISEKEKENKEFAKCLIRPVLQKTKLFSKFQREELSIQKTENFFIQNQWFTLLIWFMCIDFGWNPIKGFNKFMKERLMLFG